MRIAVVTETFQPFKGGSAKRYLEVFRRIVDWGHEVDIFTARLESDWPVFEDMHGMRVHRTEAALKDFITKDGFRSAKHVSNFTLWAIRHLLKDKFDVVEANHCPIFPAIGAWLYSRLRNRPYVVTFHEAWYSDWYRFVPRRIYAPLGITLEKVSVRLANVIVAVSSTTARRLFDYFHVPCEKIKVISNGADIHFYSKVKVDRDRFKLIYAGRLNPHKKLDWLLEAYSLVKEKYPEVKLEIVGGGPLLQHYRKIVAEKGSEKHVKLHGLVGDLEFGELLKSSGIYVLPSIREGQSITVLEAMAAGTPQVVVDVEGSGAGGLIASSGSGIAVGPSPKSIAEGIMSILSNEESWEKLHANGLSFIQNHTWDKAAEDYLELYSHIMNERP